MSKHTKGPWFINGNQRYTKYIEARIGGGMIQEVAACGPTEGYGEQESNARLIAAAPELLEALEKMLDNEEQRAFEGWLARTAPSGCCESVDAQWKMSSDYSEFLDDWDMQISAIARARGEA